MSYIARKRTSVAKTSYAKPKQQKSEQSPEPKYNRYRKRYNKKKTNKNNTRKYNNNNNNNNNNYTKNRNNKKINNEASKVIVDKKPAEKKKIIFLHGLNSGPEYFAALEKSLSDRFDIFNKGLAGHSADKKDLIYSEDKIVNYFKEAYAWANQKNTQSTHSQDNQKISIVCHSLGCSAILWAIVNKAIDQKNIDKITLVAPPLKPADDYKKMYSLTTKTLLKLSTKIRSLEKIGIKNKRLSSKNLMSEAKIDETQLKKTKSKTSKILIGSLPFVLKTDNALWAKAVKVPTQVIIPREDKLISPNDQLKVFSNLGAHKIFEMIEGGHNILKDANKEYACKIIKEFHL